MRGHMKRNDLIGVLIIDDSGRDRAGANESTRKRQHQIFSQ